MLRIFSDENTYRYIKVSGYNGIWVTAVYHGRFGDVIATGSGGGSATTYYGDYHWITGNANRVLCRGSFFAYPFGGVSCSCAYSDASYSYAYLGSRLDYCFIGSTAPPTCRHRSDRGRCAALME